MKILRKSSRTSWICSGVAFLAAALLSACAGPSTRILPRETGQESVPPEMPAGLEKANSYYIEETVEILAASSREAGSESEPESAEYIGQLLKSYGYETRIDFYNTAEDGEEFTGSAAACNVVAVCRAEDPGSDILVMTAYHDTAAGSFGANDDASGEAVMLETARLLAGPETDTELWFVSFSGRESGGKGVQAFLDAISGEERERIIGVVSLDAMGYVRDDSIVLGTADGAHMVLGDQIRETALSLAGETWNYALRERSAHSRFVRARIPAFCLGQGEAAYEYGTWLDRPAIVDVERLAEVTDVLAETFARLMSLSTPSQQAKSHFYNDLHDGAYVQRVDDTLPFGMNRAALDNQMGMSGTLVATNTDNDGNAIRAYRYLVKWLGVDQIMYSDYYFVNGSLSFVRVDADGSGATFDEMKQRLTDCYGTPITGDYGPDGPDYTWSDTIAQLSVNLAPGNSGYELTFRQMDLSEVDYNDDPRAATLRELAGVFLPEESGVISVSAIELYSDGVGGTIASVAGDGAPEKRGGDSPAGTGTGNADTGRMNVDEDGQEKSRTEETDDVGSDDKERSPGTQPVIWRLDLEDAIRADGSWLGRTATIRELARLAGETLQQQDEELFAAFEERFGTEKMNASGEIREIEEAPGFAECFQWFLIANLDPEDMGEWGERVRFFYEFEDLTVYRRLIRENLNLKEISGTSRDPAEYREP